MHQCAVQVARPTLLEGLFSLGMRSVKNHRIALGIITLRIIWNSPHPTRIWVFKVQNEYLNILNTTAGNIAGWNKLNGRKLFVVDRVK